MRDFIFENSTRFYFGKGKLEGALERELADATTVMVAYGGGPVKRTGLFDRIVAALPGKRIVEFGGIEFQIHILSFTRSLAKAVGPYGVNVNAILPGTIDTPMLGGHDYTEQAKGWALRRTGRPEELAEATCFLASDRASYMAGVGMDVNGGYVFS